jgi:hypothetical protein
MTRSTLMNIRFSQSDYGSSALIALALSGQVACAPIAVSDDHSSRVISERVDRNAYGPWTYHVGSEKTAGGLTFRVRASRECNVHAERAGERTTTVRRENKATAGTWIFGLIGLAGAGAAAWGLNQHFANDKPLSKEESDGRSKLTGPGYAVYFGSIASLGLIVGVDAAIRSWDTSSTEEFNETSDDRMVCDQRPLARARLQVVAGDHVLADKTTDAQGAAVFTCLAEQLELRSEPAEVRLNGEPASHPPLESNFDFARPTSVLATTPTAAASDQTLKLFGAPLKRARRDELTDAIRRAGGKRLEESPHVALFDVLAQGWPHARTLKVLFDGHGLFVKAKWEGDFSGSHQSELLKALSERYGVPSRLKNDDGSFTLLWAFEDGLQVRYARSPNPGSASCPAAELSYLDPAAYDDFEAAVNNAGN